MRNEIDGTPSSRANIRYNFTPADLSKNCEREDSFWHEGCSYTIGQIWWPVNVKVKESKCCYEAEQVDVVIVARGEIKGQYNGKIFYTPEEAEELGIRNDKDLAKVEWINNNWFEIELYYVADDDKRIRMKVSDDFEPVFTKKEAEDYITSLLEQDRYTGSDYELAEYIITEAVDYGAEKYKVEKEIE